MLGRWEDMCRHTWARAAPPLRVRMVEAGSSQAPKLLIDAGFQAIQNGNVREVGRECAHHDRPLPDFLASSSWAWANSSAISDLMITPL